MDKVYYNVLTAQPVQDDANNDPLDNYKQFEPSVVKQIADGRRCVEACPPTHAQTSTNYAACLWIYFGVSY